MIWGSSPSSIVGVAVNAMRLEVGNEEVGEVGKLEADEAEAGDKVEAAVLA